MAAFFKPQKEFTFLSSEAESSRSKVMVVVVVVVLKVIARNKKTALWPINQKIMRDKLKRELQKGSSQALTNMRAKDSVYGHCMHILL